MKRISTLLLAEILLNFTSEDSFKFCTLPDKRGIFYETLSVQHGGEEIVLFYAPSINEPAFSVCEYESPELLCDRLRLFFSNIDGEELRPENDKLVVDSEELECFLSANPDLEHTDEVEDCVTSENVHV